jgi:hypothetical protein
MDLDEIGESFFNFLFIAGAVGVGIILLSLVLFLSTNMGFSVFGLVLKGKPFIITLSIGMWLSTLLVPAYAKLTLLRLRTRFYAKQAGLYEKITDSIRTGDKFRARTAEGELVVIKSIFWGLFVVFPVISAIIGIIYDLGLFSLGKLDYFRFYSLLVNLIFISVYLLKYGDRISRGSYFSFFQILFILVPMVSMFVLLFVPELHPYRLITYLVISGEIPLIGARIS